MHLAWRDGLATLFVAAALGVYAAWAIGSPLAGFTRPTEVAIAVLVLGIAASISAVVPGFNAMWHGSRLYLAGASLLGVVALGAGLWSVFGGDRTALGSFVAATVILWGMSTVRHLAGYRPRSRLEHR
jgi:hypothetical protein